MEPRQGPGRGRPPARPASRGAQAPSHTNEPFTFSQYCWSPQGGVSAAHSSTSGTQQRRCEGQTPDPRAGDTVGGQTQPRATARLERKVATVWRTRVRASPGGRPTCRGDKGHLVPLGEGSRRGTNR